ncbi:MAG TPA: maleylpyruvate isomerase family mycothiol-dependent enzyme, partial [Acidimicrobiales bacterium]|nr:maleylpyruvate isomerase family mycothiol-dependent enzyme [Acidimicrobiales bacterium]
MEHAWYCDALAAELGRFADTARGVDPATPVPTCAPWDLGRLLKHVGLIHRWAEQMVREGSDTAVDQRSLDLGLPDDREDYPEWLAAGAKQLVATLRAADPDRPMWAWGPDQHARFWSRRMVHEAVIHHADAQLAVHATPRVDPDLAVDGIDEFLEILPSAV